MDISPFIKDAQKIQDQTGIPASIILGQIMLESGGRYSGGLSGLAVQGKNLFGIKGKGTAGSVSMPTTEYVNGKAVKVNADFRKYNSYYESMLDHAKLLSKDRYSKYLKEADTINEFAEGIKKGGYATDPSYVNKLLGVIQKNNLNQYDNGKIKFNPIAAADTPAGEAAAPEGNGGIMEKVFFNTVRAGLVIMLFILMVIFFLKAFPVTETVSNVAGSVNPALKKINKLTKGAKA